MPRTSSIPAKSGPACADSELVEAVVMLRIPADGSVPAPAQSREMATSALSKAASESGTSPQASTVFANLHSFSVRASRQFVQALKHDDNVARVLPNAASQPALIEPVGEQPVKLVK